MINYRCVLDCQFAEHHMPKCPNREIIDFKYSPKSLDQRASNDDWSSEDPDFYSKLLSKNLALKAFEPSDVLRNMFQMLFGRHWQPGFEIRSFLRALRGEFLVRPLYNQRPIHGKLHCKVRHCMALSDHWKVLPNFSEACTLNALDASRTQSNKKVQMQMTI